MRRCSKGRRCAALGDVSRLGDDSLVREAPPAVDFRVEGASEELIRRNLDRRELEQAARSAGAFLDLERRRRSASRIPPVTRSRSAPGSGFPSGTAGKCCCLFPHCWPVNGFCERRATDMILPEKDRMPTSPAARSTDSCRPHAERRLAMVVPGRRLAPGVWWAAMLFSRGLPIGRFISITRPAIGDPGGDPRGQCCGRVAARVGSVDSAPLEPGSRTQDRGGDFPGFEERLASSLEFLDSWTATRTWARRPCRTA